MLVFVVAVYVLCFGNEVYFYVISGNVPLWMTLILGGHFVQFEGFVWHSSVERASLRESWI